MNEIASKRRATVHDVARQAKVSLATVDRVLNNRPGVRPATAKKVDDAILALGFQRDLSASLLARARDLYVQFLIPGGSHDFMDSLAGVVGRRAEIAPAERMHIAITRLPPLDADALAGALNVLDPKSCDCVVVVAAEEPSVLTAVDAATRRGIVVMTLVSDLPGSARRHFIGIDNTAAGRTAASLLGRFCPTGPIGIIAGSLHLRDHRERLDGFRAVLESEFADLNLLDPVESHDDPEAVAGLSSELLASHPNLAGLYNLGAGNAGLMSALQAAGATTRPRVIAHELTDSTRAGLRSGLVDVVLDQNPEREIRAAIAAARSLALGGNGMIDNEPIEIGIFLRDNLG